MSSVRVRLAALTESFVLSLWLMMEGIFALALLCLSPEAKAANAHAEVGGARATLLKEMDGARIRLQSVRKFELSLRVEPGASREPLRIQVVLPKTGRNAWRAEYVHVVDEAGRAVPIRRGGTQLHRFEMAVPPAAHTYEVRGFRREPRSAVRQFRDSERQSTDAGTGLRAAICKWCDGRRAALSIRFDDSHPTHLSRAIPVLREHGFRATFMINPGRPSFLSKREEWEACMKQGDQEFGNHTLNHQGAATGEEVDRELGDVSKYIWQLFPKRSRLVALSLGGGTKWTTREPLQHWLDKYHLVLMSGSLGMDDVYGKRIAALERHVVRHVESGGWCRAHYHSIGKGHASSEASFRAAMGLVAKHKHDLWVTGLADAHKYQQEYKASRLALIGRGPDAIELRLVCATDPTLYDQPLTIQLDLPHGWLVEALRVERKDDGSALAVHDVHSAKQPGVHLHVLPVSSSYLIRRSRNE